LRYTWRQAWAFLFLAGRRHRRELAEMLTLQALAANGTSEAIKKYLADLEK